MPVINNAYPVNEENYSFAPSDLDSTHSNMSQKDINALIDSMCKTRMENPDVMLMDQIKADGQFYDPIMQEKHELEQDSIAVEEEILKGIFESETPMSIEERNELIARGMYQRYQEMKAKKQGKTVQQVAIDNNTAMSDIEAELRASINKPIEGDIESITEVIKEEEIMPTFPQDELNTTDKVDTTDINSNVSKEIVTEDDIVVETFEEVGATNVINMFEEERKPKKQLSPEALTKIVTGLPTVAQAIVDQQNLSDVIEEFNDTIDTVTSAEKVANSIGINTDEEEDRPMTVEEFNDVPATEIDLPNEVITDALMNKYDNVNYQDAIKLIEVMNRYKAKEKFNVFNELPESIKTVILQEAASVGADKSTVNFFAKTFINDLVNDTYLDREIKDFNKELNTALAPMNNIVGTMMDEYNDEVYEKFTTKLLEKAEEIKDNDPDKAEQLKVIANNFEEAVSIKRINDKLSKNPSIANKHYKNGRDSWNKMNQEYNQIIAKVSPKPRALNDCYNGLISAGYTEDYARAVISLMVEEVKDAIKCNTLEEHVYAYYLTNSIYNLNFTANNSKTISTVKSGIDTAIDSIDEYMRPLKNRKKSKKEKRRERKLKNPARKS